MQWLKTPSDRHQFQLLHKTKLEKRTDLLLSTLRSYINAMGGELELVVKFPDRLPVVLSEIAPLNDEDDREDEVSRLG